ncbi:MAG TPA: hypothetical protein VMB72_01315 [Acidimicrobiales bacterium]|nr:hypothetical protein [Acidimicrobiales bacterium]
MGASPRSAPGPARPSPAAWLRAARGADGATRAGWARRWALLVAGSTLSTLCYAVTIKASLGLGPLFVLQDGFGRTTGISIGAAVTATGFMFVALTTALRSWPGAGTLVVPVLGGVTLDALLPHVPAVPGLPLRLVAVFGATWLMALAGVLMIRAGVGINAYDGVMLGLHRLLGGRVALVRLGMEATVLVVGGILGGALGVGTVITGGLIGPGMQFWLRVTRTATLPRRPTATAPTTPAATAGGAGAEGLGALEEADPPSGLEGAY